MRRSTLALAIGFALGLAAPAALAVVPQSRPAPQPVEPPTITRHEFGGTPAASCVVAYDNTQTFSGFFYSDQNGAESADDLHMVEGGGLCTFTFGYNHPGTGTFTATIRFYGNDPGDPPPTNLVAGPYDVTGLPPGANSIQVTVPESPVVPGDVWMSVQFSRPEVGLLINDPPDVGSSDDYFYEFPSMSYLFFGGDPLANFHMGVQLELATPTRSSTWGGLKSLHR